MKKTIKVTFIDKDGSIRVLECHGVKHYKNNTRLAYHKIEGNTLCTICVLVKNENIIKEE